MLFMVHSLKLNPETPLLLCCKDATCTFHNPPMLFSRSNNVGYNLNHGCMEYAFFFSYDQGPLGGAIFPLGLSSRSFWHFVAPIEIWAGRDKGGEGRGREPVHRLTSLGTDGQEKINGKCERLHD